MQATHTHTLTHTQSVGHARSAPPIKCRHFKMWVGLTHARRRTFIGSTPWIRGQEIAEKADRVPLMLIGGIEISAHDGLAL